jgi:hypothetical protein
MPGYIQRFILFYNFQKIQNKYLVFLKGNQLKVVSMFTHINLSGKNLQTNFDYTRLKEPTINFENKE